MPRTQDGSGGGGTTRSAPSSSTLEPDWHSDVVFKLGLPADGDLDRVLADQLSAEPSYQEIGATRGHLPAGYQHDTSVLELGQGNRVFDRATEGLRNWQAHRGAGLLLRSRLTRAPVGRDARPLCLSATRGV